MRQALWLIASLLSGVVAADDLPAESGGPVGFTRTALFPGYDGKWCKVQPSVASDGDKVALLTYQMLNLDGIDVFSGQYLSKSTDGGETWSEPIPIPGSADVHERGLRVARYVNVYYLAGGGRWTAMGSATMYGADARPYRKCVDGKPYCYPIQADVDVGTDTISNFRPMPFPFKYELAMRFGQVVECEDGEVLMPFYFRPVGGGKKGRAVVIRYRFGKDGWEVVKAGTPVAEDSLARGVGEPSIVKFGGRYYMTLRSDEYGMYAESEDGLTYSKPIKWVWADGNPIGNSNTQQHWVSVGDRLYLAYTRVTPTNGHVFRNRAPVFIAEFDPVKRCLKRETEQSVVPERGARLGNFAVAPNRVGESWLVTAEWMQPKGCERNGSDNSLWLVKFKTRIGGLADCARYVDVFTGTSATGHTHPAAAFPFGMIQAGPDTGERDWDHCSGYQYGDKAVLGYSQNHLSGTGCPDYGDVRVLPFSGEFRGIGMTSAIDKSSERAEPGCYEVRQSEDGVFVEIAAVKRAAIYRFSWDRQGACRVFLNLPVGMGERNWAVVKTRKGEISTRDMRELSGWYWRKGWIQERKVAFALQFDRNWTNLERLPESEKGEAPRYVATFVLKPGEPLKMKIALSMNSAEAARRNLADSIPDWNFEETKAIARAEWNRLFARSVCEGDETQKTNWYTALYHLYLQPNDWSDAGEPSYFTTLSLWDTFRAAHPWYSVVTPEIVEPVVNSILRLWRENGRLPVMSYGGKNVDCMIGNHAVPVIVDAWTKGFRGFDAEEALTAITNTLSVAHPGKPKENWDQYLKFGYFPSDLNRGEGVSRTLECAYDDACVAYFAKILGHRDVAETYNTRSANWRKVFDSSVGFARGRDAKGRWREPFSPFALGHEDDWPADFTEGNAWQYTWHVMHDPLGLIDAFGGKERFVEKLEALFVQPSKTAGGGVVADVSGLIGQYAHGNEPCHHVIYFFQHAGRPDLTARYVRGVFDTQYHPGPDGLCGNDDCGQMSAWYLFSAMGFYPFNPCGGEYVIGAPQLPRVTLKLPGGKTLVVVAKGLSKQNKYVKSVELNGRPLLGWKIAHTDILKGGELVFVMTGEEREASEAKVSGAN